MENSQMCIEGRAKARTNYPSPISHHKAFSLFSPFGLLSLFRPLNLFRLSTPCSLPLCSKLYAALCPMLSALCFSTFALLLPFTSL